MKFEYYNPNPNAKVFKSGKPKSWNINDSAIRAICKVTNKSWIEIYTELDEFAKIDFDMISNKPIVNKVLANYNFKYITLGKPLVGQKRPTVKEFADSHNKGKFILYLRDYYVTIINGILYNTDESIYDSSIYSYWEYDL